MESTTELIVLTLLASILLTMFAAGLSASFEDAIYLFRRPGQLLRSLVSLYIVLPLFAIVVIFVFDLHQALEIGLISLMVSPMSPLLMKKMPNQGESASYMIGLAVAAGVLAIVTVPLSVLLLGYASGASISPAAVTRTVVISVIAPLAAGLLIRQRVPAFAQRIERPASLLASLLLIAGLLPMLFIVMPMILQLLYNGAVVAIVAIAVAGLAAGHLLGGPGPANRMVLALSNPSRHPGVAISIAIANFPDQASLIFAGILLYLLISSIIVTLYQKWYIKSAGTAN